MNTELQPKYILVTGGELNNKGAQAMTFITVDQVARRFPECKVVLFSGQDYVRSEEEKTNYKFKIMPFPGLGEIVSLCTGLLKKRYLARENGKCFAEYKHIFQNAVALLDISGYALGSKWSNHFIEGYLRKIAIAKHFHIPVYLMPQSFGPFDFQGKKAWLYHKAIKHYLSGVKLIMAREMDGLTSLQNRYKLKNVIKTPDLVLQNKELCLENIYHTIPEQKKYVVEEHSVAIIPNSKNNKFGNEKSILKMYENIVCLLIEKGKHVYMLYHAVEDLKICQTIKNTYFSDNQAVHLIEEELSCIAFDDIVEKFDFIIGSRFHSIVHAYRKSVPAVVLGWAVKYKELTGCFEQQEYCFDVTDESSYSDILEKIEQLCNKYSEESAKISAGVTEIQKESVYDLISVKS